MGRQLPELGPGLASAKILRRLERNSARNQLRLLHILTKAVHCFAMDSPVVTQIFRQLFRHPACQSTRSTSLRRLNATGHDRSLQQHQQRRSFLTKKGSYLKSTSTNDGTMWTKRGDYPRDIDQQLRTFPLVTAKDLRNRRERPTRVKMLTREFIEGQSC